jgi:hypothetical protein
MHAANGCGSMRYGRCGCEFNAHEVLDHALSDVKVQSATPME